MPEDKQDKKDEKPSYPTDDQRDKRHGEDIKKGKIPTEDGFC